MILTKQSNICKTPEELKLLTEFYEVLAFTVMGFATKGTRALINIDTYTFSSMAGTLDSINMILSKGRINDAYTLLRKYHDFALINVYTNLYIEENCTLENYFVTQILDWLKGSGEMPTYNIMKQYIEKSDKLNAMTVVLNADDRYSKLRERCNDHMHYNSYQNVLLNDSEVYVSDRAKALEVFTEDLLDIFVLHFAYIFSLHQHYMGSTDYIDSLELGFEPTDGSQYWVASFVQNLFDSIVQKRRPELAKVIKENSCMEIK